jgi:hypothetical protein
MRHFSRLIAVLLPTLAAVACRESARSKIIDSGTTRPAPVVSSKSHGPRDAVITLLEIMSSPAHRASASSDYMDCSPDGVVEPLYTLASFAVDSVVTKGDSAMATVSLVVVARENQDEHGTNRYVVTVGAQRITGTWLVKQSRNGIWRVCGISKEGVDFGHNGEDDNSRFVPAGATWSSVYALADSVKRAK